MVKRLATAALFLVSSFALGAEKAALQPLAPTSAGTLYQIDLVSSEKLISRDLPVLKGTTYICHQYPTGTLISIRKSTVKQITKLNSTAAAAVNPTAIKPIGDLAMQGPKSVQSGGYGRPANMGRARDAAAAAAAGTASRTGYPY